MEFLKIVAYVQKHAVAAAFVAFLVAPATWGIVSNVYAAQFAALGERIMLLQETLAQRTDELSKAEKELTLMRDINAIALQPTRSTNFRKLFNESPNAAAIAKALQ